MSGELCRTRSCRSGGEGPGRARKGGFLCLSCQDRLTRDLLNLPALYADCSNSNGGSGADVVRIIKKTPRKSATRDSMNPAAAEVRTTIRTVLASWAGLVADERRLRRPARDIPTLARFLGRHLEWLTCHPAAGDLAEEVRDLTRTARDIAYPDSVRRVPVGGCPEDGCTGDLFAHIRAQDDLLPSEIICTLSSCHSWPVTWWTRLARRIHTRQGESA